LLTEEGEAVLRGLLRREALRLFLTSRVLLVDDEQAQ
jgi:hypothetical protein